MGRPKNTLTEAELNAKGYFKGDDGKYSQSKPMSQTAPEKLPQAPKNRNKKHEENLQLEVCNYIALTYTNVLFMSDVAAGMKLTKWQAVKASKMRSNRGLPDLIIFSARGGFFGLMLELKKEGTVINLKNGGITSDTHIREQMEVHVKLRNEGYCVTFAVGFDEAVRKIDGYMALI